MSADGLDISQQTYSLGGPGTATKGWPRQDGGIRPAGPRERRRSPKEGPGCSVRTHARIRCRGSGENTGDCQLRVPCSRLWNKSAAAGCGDRRPLGTMCGAFASHEANGGEQSAANPRSDRRVHEEVPGDRCIREVDQRGSLGPAERSLREQGCA